jgi:putative transposase
VDTTLSCLLHTASCFDLAVLAYCFMPDHLHTLMSGQTECASLTDFVHRFKQRTGFRHRRIHRKPLWQPGYHERVLRDDESTGAVARYILENPVRAGLSTQLGEYPYAGSPVYAAEALLTAWDRRRT